MRQANSVVSETVPSIGNWVSAQISPITPSRICVGTRLAMKPTTTAEIEKKRKKALPTFPNCSLVNWRSRMIGTAERPMMALSAKLISMNRNSMPTTAHARRAIAGYPLALVMSRLLPLSTTEPLLMFAGLRSVPCNPRPNSSPRSGPLHRGRLFADRFEKDRHANGAGMHAEMRGHLQNLKDLGLVDAE